MSNPIKTLIIGAGPGGLALAQMLRAKGEDFEIFERDSSVTSRQQGWAVALVECLPDLEALLPSDLGPLSDTSVNKGLAPYDSLALMDAVSGKVMGGIGAVPRGQPGYMVRANRAHFRDYLFQNLKVHFGKSFERYEEDRDGIIAFFSDGTTAKGDILIGADGAHSHVRRAMLGSSAAANIPSAFVPIIQELQLSKKQFSAVHKLGTAAIIAGRNGLTFLVGLLESLDRGKSARYYTATCIKSTDSLEESKWVAQASAQKRYDRVMREIIDCPALLTDLVKSGGVEGFVGPQIRFEEFVPPDLPHGRVTLLGDAAHTMVPFRGAGANTAVADAVTFAKLVFAASGSLQAGVQHDDRRTDAKSLIEDYNAIMLQRGREMVLKSREAGDDLLGPMRGRLNTYVAPTGV